MKTQTQYTLNELLNPTPSSIQNKEDYLYFLKIWKEVYKYYSNQQAINKIKARIQPSIRKEKLNTLSNRIKALEKTSQELINNMTEQCQDIIKTRLLYHSSVTPIRNRVTYGTHAICIQLLITRALMKARYKELYKLR